MNKIENREDVIKYDYTSTNWKEALGKVLSIIKQSNDNINVWSSEPIDESLYHSNKYLKIIIECAISGDPTGYKARVIKQILMYALGNIDMDLNSAEFIELGIDTPFIRIELPSTPTSIKNDYEKYYKKYLLK